MPTSDSWDFFAKNKFANLHTIVYNVCMKYHTLRVWETTLKKLRRIYAETGESMIAIVDRLADQELKRIQDANRPNVQVQALPLEKE
jgi:hypothetical protein